jgi:ketosteroid isomerase-like protein
MRRVFLWGSLLALAVALTACPPPEREPVDVEAGLDELREGYLEAYNRHDADALAGFYTEDAIFVDADGTEVRGRDEIRQQLEPFFAGLRPRLDVSPEETAGEDRLAWQFGSYVIEPQPPMDPAMPPAMPGEPGTPPTTPEEPGTPPATPGQPGVSPPGQPGQPRVDPMTMQRQEGRYLIVLEHNQDRWLIRAQVNNLGRAPGVEPGEPRVVPPPGEPPVAPRPGEPQPELPPEEPVAPPPTEPEPPSPPEEEPDDDSPPS